MRGHARGRVGAGRIERLRLQQRLREALELIAMVAQQVRYVLVRALDELCDLLVDESLG